MRTGIAAKESGSPGDEGGVAEGSGSGGKRSRGEMKFEVRDQHAGSIKTGVLGLLFGGRQSVGPVSFGAEKLHF